MSIKSWIGHRARELAVHASRCVQSGRGPRVLFCVSSGSLGMSAGLRGYDIARVLRTLGWRATVIPHQLELSQRRRIIRMERPDALVFQTSRHPLNRPRLYPDTRCVLDLDDADFLDPNRTAELIECAAGSAAAIAGSAYIARWLEQHGPKVQVIWTGAPVPKPTPTNDNRNRRSVIAWACSSPEGYPAELRFVQEIVTRLAQMRSFEFWIVGTGDERQTEHILQPLRDGEVSCRSYPFMPYDRLYRLMREAAIGLAPLLPDASGFSAGKSFGKVLVYLRAHTATIASNNVDHPLFFQHGVNGMLADTPDEWVESITHLLDEPDTRHAMAERAYEDFVNRLSTEAAAALTDRFLRSIIDSK